jgi:hypothetical protein
VFSRLKKGAEICILCAMCWCIRMRTLQQKLHRLTAGVLVLWLAVFYPAMCDYHGLLLFRTTEPAQDRGSAASAQPPGASTSVYQQSQHHDHATVSTSSAGAGGISSALDIEIDHTSSSRPKHHKPLAGESAAAGLLSVLAPSNFALSHLQIRTSFVLLAVTFCHQYQHPPPDQPPRFSAV